jgi:alpha-glucoside transport system substrate-binding protein
MKFRLALGAAALALVMAAPASAELKFKPGEDARFNWENFRGPEEVDLKGETLTIFGPWRGDDEALVQVVLGVLSARPPAPMSSIPRPKTTSSRW